MLKYLAVVLFMDVTEYVNGRQLAAWRRDMNNNGGEMERTALSTSVKGLSPTFTPQHTMLCTNNNYKEVVIIQLKFNAICAMFYFNSVHNSSSHNKELKN